MSQSFLIGKIDHTTSEWIVYGIAESEIAAQEWVRDNVPGWEGDPELQIMPFQTITRRAPLANGHRGVV